MQEKTKKNNRNSAVHTQRRRSREPHDFIEILLSEGCSIIQRDEEPYVVFEGQSFAHLYRPHIMYRQPDALVLRADDSHTIGRAHHCRAHRFVSACHFSCYVVVHNYGQVSEFRFPIFDEFYVLFLILASFMVERVWVARSYAQTPSPRISLAFAEVTRSPKT